MNRTNGKVRKCRESERVRTLGYPVSNDPICTRSAALEILYINGPQSPRVHNAGQSCLCLGAKTWFNLWDVRVSYATDMSVHTRLSNDRVITSEYGNYVAMVGKTRHFYGPLWVNFDGFRWFVMIGRGFNPPALSNFSSSLNQNNFELTISSEQGL